MIVIHKHTLEYGSNILHLPKIAKPLKCTVQEDKIAMWVGTDTNLTTVARTFNVVETGEEIDDSEFNYIDTVMFNDKTYILHVLEKG